MTFILCYYFFLRNSWCSRMYSTIYSRLDIIVLFKNHILDRHFRESAGVEVALADGLNDILPAVVFNKEPLNVEVLVFLFVAFFKIGWVTLVVIGFCLSGISFIVALSVSCFL